MNHRFTPLEQAVLEKLLEGDLPLLLRLKQQLKQATVANREVTGVGYYTTIAVPEVFPRMAGFSVKFGDVLAEIPGLSNGAGFLLYIKNGVLDLLESYSYDESWPSTIDSFTLRFSLGKERDWKALEIRLKPP